MTKMYNLEVWGRRRESGRYNHLRTIIYNAPYAVCRSRRKAYRKGISEFLKIVDANPKRDPKKASFKATASIG